MPLPKEFKINSNMTPAISIINNIKYIFPGWIKVDNDVTLKDVHDKWEKPPMKKGRIPTLFLDSINLKMGDKIRINDYDSKIIKEFSTCFHILYKDKKYSIKKDSLFTEENKSYSSKEKYLNLLKRQ